MHYLTTLMEMINDIIFHNLEKQILEPYFVMYAWFRYISSVKEALFVITFFVSMAPMLYRIIEQWRKRRRKVFVEKRKIMRIGCFIKVKLEHLCTSIIIDAVVLNKSERGFCAIVTSSSINGMIRKGHTISMKSSSYKVVWIRNINGEVQYGFCAT